MTQSLYRVRRLRDAARLLPVLGVVLWFIPLLWSLRSTTVSSSVALIYLFAVWLMLVILCAVISTRLAQSDPEPEP